MHLRPPEVRPLHLRPPEVRPLHLRPPEVRPLHLRPPEVRSLHLRPPEERSLHLRPIQVRVAKVEAANIAGSEVGKESSPFEFPGGAEAGVIVGEERLTVCGGLGGHPALCPENPRAMALAGCHQSGLLRR